MKKAGRDLTPTHPTRRASFCPTTLSDLPAPVPARRDDTGRAVLQTYSTTCRKAARRAWLQLNASARAGYDALVRRHWRAHRLALQNWPNTRHDVIKVAFVGMVLGTCLRLAS